MVASKFDYRGQKMIFVGYAQSWLGWLENENQYFHSIDVYEDSQNVLQKKCYNIIYEQRKIFFKKHVIFFSQKMFLFSQFLSCFS